MRFDLGIDLGGTNISAGVMDETGVLRSLVSVKTGSTREKEEILRDIRRSAVQAAEACGQTIASLSSLGMGFPGTVDRKRKVFIHASNLPALDGYAMGELFPELSEECVFLENDANAAALGELFDGAGKGAESFVMLTLGTGIGCGIVENGRIYTGINGAAGEAGHMVIQKDGRQCTCGRKGCFEQYASATGLIQTTTEEMILAPESLMWDLCGGETGRITGRTAFDGMRRGDEAARRAVHRYIEDLAAGTINLILLLQPERLIFGGGVSAEGETLLAPLRALVRKNAYPTGGKETALHVASCPHAGVVGAARLYTQEKEKA